MKSVFNVILQLYNFLCRQSKFWANSSIGSKRCSNAKFSKNRGSITMWIFRSTLRYELHCQLILMITNTMQNLTFCRYLLYNLNNLKKNITSRFLGRGDLQDIHISPVTLWVSRNWRAYWPLLGNSRLQATTIEFPKWKNSINCQNRELVSLQKIY